MKALALPLAALLLFATPAPAGEIAPTDAKALAASYGSAFENMGKSSVAIVYANGDQVEIIKDVNQITACGSVLLVKIFGGGKQILDATRVIKIMSN